MAVSADEQVGHGGIKLLAYARVVLPWVSAYVGHHNLCLLALPCQCFGVYPAQVASVYVAVHGLEGPDVLQAVGQFQGTDVAGMPYLVAFGEVFGIAFVPVGVGVGEEGDAGHWGGKFL